MTLALCGIRTRCGGMLMGSSGRTIHVRLLPHPVFLTLLDSSPTHRAQVWEEESAVDAAQGYYHFKLNHEHVTVPAPPFCGAYGGYRRTTTVKVPRAGLVRKILRSYPSP
ncbi:unnamed protein product [Schistocephalus solidus]|uniref:Secreted protein n=1 Tax=Schistocephalus solidus TaxID=70667 RepID=A0A183T8N0_SCHSO|nr:unnamed protein product [Schistocephalus solidus]